jgi:hypothetical protein
MIELQLPYDEPTQINLPRTTQPELLESVTTLQPMTIKPQSNFVPLAIAFVFGALISFILLREIGHDSIDRDQSQDQKQVIDDKQYTPKPMPPNASLKDCLLLVVRDAKSTNESAEYTATLQNDTFWRVTAPSIVKDVEFLEDDDDTSKKLITAAGIPAPFVMLFNSASKKMVWSIPLPKGSVSEIERKLK